MKKNKIEFKPCPFCGSKNIKVLEYGNWKNFYCECKDCRAIVPDPSSTDYTEEEAIEAWNKRNDLCVFKEQELWNVISVLSDIRSKYSLFDDDEEIYYHACSAAIKCIRNIIDNSYKV